MSASGSRIAWVEQLDSEEWEFVSISLVLSRRLNISLVLSLSKDERTRTVAPRGIAAHARDAELSRELEMRFQLIAIH